ncbi:non-ribosomal peptide synthetase [Streptococcus jiangjianxini]|uniref:non-ribosomal peptide synthetase n=1 Tax=Streptococcus jiangjianxini TaxID=3161189 RepID=UPI0032ECC0EE
MKQDFLNVLYKHSQSDSSKIALIDGNIKLSYKDLVDNVEKRILELSNYDFSDKIVALQLPRSIEFVITVLALMKMEVTFIPQDISQPEERLNKMLEISHANYVIKYDNSVYSINKINSYKNNTKAWAIYFTSGSTGLPKAVEITRENVENTVIWEKELFQLSEKDHMALFTAYSFAISYIELFSGLYAKCTLHILDEKIRHDFNLLENYLNSNKITFMNITASIGEFIIRKMNLEYLRVLTLSGQRFPNVSLEGITYKVFNIYGNTECGAATATEITNDTNTITIGKTVRGMGAVILDENRNVLSNGEIGELFLFGSQIASGYYLDPEATKSSFISVNIDGKMVSGYRSGDFARILEDGNIQYFGRKDRQYKINGIRIDLSEIENALKNILPNVEQSYIFVRENLIFCWIVQEDKVNEDEVISELKNLLPEIMIPKRIIKIDSLPLNGNGKTDESKLFDILDNISSIQDNRILSKEVSDMEEYLKVAWSEILGISKNHINYQSDFKKLGATSLQIMELGIKVLQDLGKMVNFVEIYNHSKLFDLANLLLEDNFKPIYTFIERSPKMGDALPLFVIHSGNTGSDVYRPLFENISNAKFPIYIIEPYNLMSQGERINGIENIAKFYIELIKSFLVEKDCNRIKLMGWSYGGVIASEMCYQLADSDTKVEELIVLDAPFYLEEKDYQLAAEREENGYYRKYFENTHIFKGMDKLNITTEHLLKNNHEVFNDLFNYTPKKINNSKVTFVRSIVEENPLTDIQIRRLFDSVSIVDVSSKHDYLFIEEHTKSIIQGLLHIEGRL